MIDHTASALYLLKAENNEVFGPVNFQQLTTWATSAQISPLDKVSTDQQTWFKAPMVPELGMDWLIELTADQLYGPTTIGALQEFLNLGEINADTQLINARDGSAAVVRDLNTLTIPPEEPRTPRPVPMAPYAPAFASASSSASANWRTRCSKSGGRTRHWRSVTPSSKPSTSKSSSSDPDRTVERWLRVRRGCRVSCRRAVPRRSSSLHPDGVRASRGFPPQNYPPAHSQRVRGRRKCPGV